MDTAYPTANPTALDAPTNRRLQLPRLCRLTSAIALVAALSTVTACGSSDDKDATPVDPALVRAEWENCMKDQGIEGEFYDESGGNEVEQPADPDDDGPPLDVDALNAASEECDHILDQIDDPLDNLSAEQEAAYEDWGLEITKCLADKGFDVSNDQSAVAHIDSDAYDAAYADCETEIEVPDELVGVINP